MRSCGQIVVAATVGVCVLLVFLWPLLDLPETVVRGKQRALLQLALLAAAAFSLPTLLPLIERHMRPALLPDSFANDIIDLASPLRC